jgi:hypothetical protein
MILCLVCDPEGQSVSTTLQLLKHYRAEFSDVCLLRGWDEHPGTKSYLERHSRNLNYQVVETPGDEDKVCIMTVRYL